MNWPISFWLSSAGSVKGAGLSELFYFILFFCIKFIFLYFKLFIETVHCIWIPTLLLIWWINSYHWRNFSCGRVSRNSLEQALAFLKWLFAVIIFLFRNLKLYCAIKGLLRLNWCKIQHNLFVNTNDAEPTLSNAFKYSVNRIRTGFGPLQQQLVLFRPCQITILWLWIWTSNCWTLNLSLSNQPIRIWNEKNLSLAVRKWPHIYIRIWISRDKIDQKSLYEICDQFILDRLWIHMVFYVWPIHG